MKQEQCCFLFMCTFLSVLYVLQWCSVHYSVAAAVSVESVFESVTELKAHIWGNGCKVADMHRESALLLVH